MESSPSAGSPSPRAGAPRVVLLTAPDGTAAVALARDLVEKRLAACVNLVPGVRSVYRWKGEVQEDGEALLIVKTVEERLGALEAWLVDAHPYDVPECIALVPGAVEEKYLEWLLREVSTDA